jgi:hypothetical protein
MSSNEQGLVRNREKVKLDKENEVAGDLTRLCPLPPSSLANILTCFGLTTGSATANLALFSLLTQTRVAEREHATMSSTLSDHCTRHFVQYKFSFVFVFSRISEMGKSSNMGLSSVFFVKGVAKAIPWRPFPTCSGALGGRLLGFRV